MRTEKQPEAWETALEFLSTWYTQTEIGAMLEPPALGSSVGQWMRGKSTPLPPSRRALLKAFATARAEMAEALRPFEEGE